MPSLFISYRREDTVAYAGRLYDHLSSHFGADKVFMDIGQIAPGEDFVEVLDARIRSSDVVIALIGPAWLSVSNEQGRRIEQADDFVRYELAAALTQGKRLIPVLVGGARMPNGKELPAGIGALARCQAHAVDDTRFEYDLDALIRSIERRPSLLRQFMQLASAERLRKWRQGITASIALLMLFSGWVQLFDVFGIDARIESYTMALGDLVSSVPLSDRIVIVSFDQRSEVRLGSPGPGWRHEHARLIDRLVDGGAKVIAFDLFFEKPGSDDAELLAAIHRARERGSRVFVGVRQLLAGRPALIDGLSEAVNGAGLLCVGGRIAYASIAPLVVAKIAAAAGSSGSGTLGDNGRLPALSLLAAGAATIAIDERLQQLTIVTDRGQTLWQGPLQPVRPQVEASGELSNDCPLLSAGDHVAEAMIRLAPVAAWRDPFRRHDFEQVVGPGATIKPGQLDGKIVLVGDARPGKDEFRVLQGLRPELRHGVELHADVVNNLLQGVHVRRLGATPQFLLMLLLATAAGWIRVAWPVTSALARGLVLFAVVSAYLAATIVIYTSYGVLLNTAYHLGAFLLSYWLLGRLTVYWRQVSRDRPL
jgi:CHASE2 domain-containing sensor protein